MASAQEQYTDEMKDRFGYYAAWNPGTPFALGDIGVLRDNLFTRLSNVSELGFTFDIREDPTKTPLEHSSRGSVSVTTKLSGALAPQGSALTDADAGIIVEFSRENATLFKANNTTSPSILDAIKLGDQIIERYRQGRWNKKWVVITELVMAESATIIISNSANGKIELKANADVHVPSIDIADAALNFSTQFSRGLETKIISQEHLTPLFKLMGMKTRIYMPPVFGTKYVAPFDLVTPETAANQYKNDIYFGYISSEQTE
jgi:hypothetical protein